MKKEMQFEENYDITLEEAKEKDFYKFTQKLELKEIKKQLDNNTFDLSDNTPIVLEFGNVDIELTIHDVDNTSWDVGYFICYKNDEDNTFNRGWESFDYADVEVDFDVEDIEKEMFNIMMDIARKNDLYWSKLNK